MVAGFMRGGFLRNFCRRRPQPGFDRGQEQGHGSGVKAEQTGGGQGQGLVNRRDQQLAERQYGQ